MIGRTREHGGRTAPAATEPDGVLLARRLAAFQRRLRRVLAFRVFCIAEVAAVVTTGAVTLLFGTALPETLELLGGTLAIALAISVVVAVLRTPTLAETARRVDRRESLQNRAASALQFLDQHDVMAALVVRDAAHRLSGLEPSTVFPRQYPARPQALVAAVAVGSLLFAVAVSRRSGSGPGWDSASSSAASPAGAAQARLQGPGARAASPSAAAPSEGSAIARGAEPARPGEADRTEAAAAAATAPRDRGNAAESRAQAATSAQPGGAKTPAAPPDATSSSREYGLAGDRPGSAGNGGRAARRDARVPAANAQGGAGAGGGAVSKSVRAGGGVKGGALDSRITLPATSRTIGPRSPDYAAAYRTAWTRAQAALSQDRVPPALRDYVKRYFAAIRSPRQQ